jgi:prepilin-type N-terminal cleavage/methylation domain-containing protein
MTATGIRRPRGFTLYELLTALGIGSLLFALFLPAIAKSRVAAVRAQSLNNLKQIGIATFGIVTRTDGLMPPSTGRFPGEKGPNATIFFHMLSDIEQDNVYVKFKDDPSKVPDTTTIKTYLSTLDPSCMKENTALTSYASNATVFGLADGGSCRLPNSFNAKGTSNTVLFMERYARTGTKAAHYWYDTAATRTYLYPNAKGAEVSTNIVNPQFGVAFDSTDPAIIDDTAHAFTPMTLYVGLADGSARFVTPAITTTFTLAKVKPDPSVWQWACALGGTLGDSATPAGW